MRKSPTHGGKNDATGRTTSCATWSSEFERMFVMGARIRGEKKSGRQHSGSFQAYNSPRR